jgi:tetratricopeptide (TPR) repeat protein
LKQGDVRYTRELSELLASLRDLDRLRAVFDAFLQSEAVKDPGRRYLVLVDYADALAILGVEEDAWNLFDQAIQLHPQNNIEAVNRYARRLIDRGLPEKAAELIESALTHDQRLRYVLPAYLWREALQKAGQNTTPADEEIRAIKAGRTRVPDAS